MSTSETDVRDALLDAPRAPEREIADRWVRLQPELSPQDAGTDERELREEAELLLSALAAGLTGDVLVNRLVAIIDITGVPAVDTAVAQHLMHTVNAVRLMGADCVISGIRPSLAHTVAQLGIDLSTVLTKATLADAPAAAVRLTERPAVPDSGAPAGL